MTDDNLIECVARAVRRNRFVRTRRLAVFDENNPPTDNEIDDARAAIVAHDAVLVEAGLMIVPRKLTATVISNVLVSGNYWYTKAMLLEKWEALKVAFKEEE